MTIESFKQALKKNGLELTRGRTTTLQINVGYLCNQTCRHCHLDAGPGQRANMTAQTVDDVIAYAEKTPFQVIDITGGAPEMNQNLGRLVEGASSCAPRVLLRSNLSTLNRNRHDQLLSILKQKRVVLIASLPSFNESQTDAQRGDGVFSKSISALKKLNALGYGHEDSGLELNLVSNPTGAFLPSSQEQMEKRFRQVLMKKWGILFNRLFTFANVPLGRFKEWLEESGNYENYIEKLVSSFNPCALEGVMCRTLVSVSWDGYLFDCDFNLAVDLFQGKRKTHVSEMNGLPEEGSAIAVGDHCFACTAGVGFT